MIYYNKMRHEIGREKETGRFMGDMERGIEEGCFLPRVEDEGQRYGRNKDTAINHTYINSGSYRRKFDFISDSPDLNRLIFQLSKKILEHRSGTKFEDMYWIDAAHRRVIAKETESCSEEQIVYSNSIRSKISKYENLITLHSHPNSYPPSINDLNSNFINHYGLGIVACHDGKIFKYASNQEIRKTIIRWLLKNI